MATKTISVSLEAYEILKAARLSEDESFSHVISRAFRPTKNGTAGDLLALLNQEEFRDSRPDVKLLDWAQAHDSPPEDPWQK